MADKRVSVVFDASMNIGQIKTSLGQLNKFLESTSIKLPQTTFNNLTKLISGLKTELGKIEGLSNQPLDGKGIKQIGKSYDKIFSSFQQIRLVMKDIEHSTGLDASKFFPDTIGDNIIKATKALEAYKKALAEGPKSDDFKNKNEALKQAKADLKSEKAKRDRAETAKKAAEIRKEDLKVQKEAAELEKQQANNEVKAAEEERRKAESQRRTLKQWENLQKKITEAKEAEKKAEEKARPHREKARKTEADSKKSTDTETYREHLRLAEKFESQAAEARKEVEKLTEELEAAQKAEENIKAAEEKRKAAKTRGDEAGKTAKNLGTKINKQSDIIGDNDAEIAIFTQNIEKAEEKVQQLEQALEEAKQAFQEQQLGILISEFEKLGITLPETSRNLEGVETALKNLSDEARGKLVSALEAAGMSLQDLGINLERLGREKENLEDMGEAAQRAAREMDQLKNQVFDFFSIGNTIQIFKNAIRDAFDTVKELDAVMTETAVVTDFSIGDMWGKLPEYASKASAMGASIKDLYSATTLYYQQGLNTDEAMGLGIETMKMARIANMEATAATEAMTAALRGFNMEINDMNAQRINDVYSELAAVTAADTSQIATAMSKTASIASSANMEFETTAAFLAQIIETTQEAPETAGTAMKTIIARFTEVKELFDEGMLTGEDAEGEEININKIDAALKTVGISLKDFLTGAKGIDDIFLELASKWDTLDLATQRYIATTAAGSRQQSRFIAMMSNYDRTMELVGAANNSAGASQEQFNKTLDSLDAKLQRLQNAWAEFTMGLANNQAIKAGVDLLTMLLETINKLTGATGNEGFGGFVTSFSKLLVLIGALKVGSNIFQGIFGSLGAEGGIKLTEKILPTLTAFKEVDSAGKMLNITLKGLEGGWQGLLRSLIKTKTFWSNTAKDIMSVGKGMGVLGQQASAAGNSLALFGLGFAKIAAIVAVVVVAITALVQIFKAIQAASPEGQLEAAKIATQEAGEAAEAAAESYNNLKSALDSLGGKESNLEGLTRGTQEWRDAVQELNADVLALVNNYPELGAFLENKGGVLSLNAVDRFGNTIDSILQSYSDQIFKSQAIYAMNQIKENEISRRVELQQLQRSMGLEYVVRTNAAEERTSKEAQIERILQELVEDFKRGTLIGEEGETEEQLLSRWLEQSGYGEYRFRGEINLETLNNYAKAEKAMASSNESQYLSAAISALNMANLTPSKEEAISNLDSDFLSKGYEKTYADVLKNLQEITSSDLQNFAYENVKGGYSYKDGKLYLNGTELSLEQAKQEMAAVRATEQYAKTLENLSTSIDNEFLKSLITEDGKDITKETLQKYAKYDTNADIYRLKTDNENINNLAKEAGYETIEEMAKAFDMTIPELTNILVESFEAAGDRMLKSRKSVVANMSKYAEDFQGYDANAGILAAMEEVVGESYLPALENLFGSLEKTGDKALISGAFEAFKGLGITEKSVAEIDNLISDIDWTNPIQAANALASEVKYGSETTKIFAERVQAAGSSFLGAASQVKYFVESADYEEMKEDLTEILETNGEIAATDISELTDQFDSLNDLLENTGMSAAAAAKMIQGLIQGKFTVEQLSSAVIAAIGQFDSLASVSANIIDKMSNFDLGIDENQVTETLGNWSEILTGNLKKGAYGNTQNFRILDFLFGEGWDEGLDGEKLTGQALAKRMEDLSYMIEQNAETMWHSWDDLAKGRNYKGEYFNKSILEGLNITHNAQGGFDVVGYENMTTAQIVDIVKNAYGVTKEYAEMMVTDFKNHSLDMATELSKNDFVAGVKAAQEELETSGKQSIDRIEIQAIADFYGKDFEDVSSLFEGITITDFFEADNETLKKTSDILTQLDNLSGGKEGAFLEQFFGKAKTLDGEKLTEDLLNISELEYALANLNIPEEGRDRIIEDVYNSLSSGAEEGQQKISAILSDGQAYEIDVAEGQSVDQAIAYAEQQLQNANLADAIAQAIGEVFKIKTIFDDKNFIDFKTRLESFFSKIFQIDVEINDKNKVLEGDQNQSNSRQSSGPVAPELDTSKLQSEVNAILSNNVLTFDASASVAVGEAAITQMTRPRNLVIWVDFDLTGGGMDVIGGFLGAVGGHAKGIKNSPSEHDALVSEEGPELIQTKDGFYLTGQNGPEMAHINKGDTVYTAEETKQILKPRNHKLKQRFASGFQGYVDHLQSGEGGGSNDDEDEEPWENSFDKLYNLVRQIEEENRQRERIERRYEQLLDSIATSAKGLVEISREELLQLETERHLQEDLIAGRLQQIAEYEAEKGLTDYAWTETNQYGEKILRVNWELIDAITDQEAGDNVSDYISQLEEWVDSINEAEDTLIDIEDTINDIKERGEDEYFDLEEKIKDAVIKAREAEIDELSQIDQSITNSASNILDSLQKTLDRSRQARDNQETEDELADKRRQLAYLQQDTSGANDLKIRELEKEIKEGTTDYTDQLIDQKISELQEQNEKASEQRQWQIELAQQQLEQYINSGEVWNEVYKLMDEGLDPENGLVRGSKLAELLKTEEAFEGMSVIGKMKWWEELNDMIAQSLGYLELGRQIEDLAGQEGIPKAGEQIVFYKDGKYHLGTVDEKGNVTSDGKKYNNVYQGYDGRFYAGENYKENEIRLDNEGNIIMPEIKPSSGSGDSSDDYWAWKNWLDSQSKELSPGGTDAPYAPGQEPSNKLTLEESYNQTNKLYDQYLDYQNKADSATDYVKKNQYQNQANNKKAEADASLIETNKLQQQAQQEILDYFSNPFNRHYKTGGLADFTGPAWLDGTKAKPEYVLNATQTKGFLTLIDILDSIKAGTFQSGTQNTRGDTFDIDINIETVREEVDVDMVAEKVQKSVVTASKYRNNIFAKR